MPVARCDNADKAIAVMTPVVPHSERNTACSTAIRQNTPDTRLYPLWFVQDKKHNARATPYAGASQAPIYLHNKPFSYSFPP
jgi:hypothetical protein